MSELEFDHIAIAVPRMADAPPVLVGALGGTPTGDGGPAGAYTWAQWGFAGGGRLEILEPLDLPIYVDHKVLAHDWVILGSGSRSSKVRVTPEVLTRLPGARVASLSV